MFQSFCQRDEVFKHTKEVPATVPVYEGYLYWYSDKKKWKWRLFRFDGLSFICLSSRKVKLPRDTPIELLGDHEDDDDPIRDDPKPALSPTSPLLATPEKYPHAPYTDNSLVMASHYQLPSWSVNLLQVTSISLLTTTPHNDKPISRFQQQQQQQHQQRQQSSNCFCIRTLDEKCFILKARKHKDLDRWLFILTKAWDWTRNQRQRQEEYRLYHQETKCPSLPPQLPPLNISCFDKSNGPPTPPPHFSPPPPPSPLQQQQQQQIQQDQYDIRYTNAILSPEKEKWIDEWRDSVKLTATTLPDDLASRSPQPDSPYGVVSSTTTTAEQVKKKRSEEVKNWISSNYQPQDHQGYDVQYFQDANTTTDHANDTSSSNQQHSHHSRDKAISKPQVPTPPSLHYHRSTRGKIIQIVHHPHQLHHHDDSQSMRGTTTSLPAQQQQQQQYQQLPTPPFDNHSPLHTLSKVESTQDIYKLQSNYQRRLSIPIDHNSNHSNSHQNSKNDRPLSIATSHYYPQRTQLAIVAPSLPPQPGSTTSTSSFLKRPLSLIKQQTDRISWHQESPS